MMKRCGVPQCDTTDKTDPDLRFHVLPAAEDKKRIWMKAIRYDNLTPSRKSIWICSLHFRDGKKTYVHDQPTIFPWSEVWPALIEEYKNRPKTSVKSTIKPWSLRKRSRTPDPLAISDDQITPAGCNAKKPLKELRIILPRLRHQGKWVTTEGPIKKSRIISGDNRHLKVGKEKEVKIRKTT